MIQQKNGGPAFPVSVSDPASGIQLSSGMTLRDYFAGQAMQAAATNPTGAEGFTFAERAAWAYQQADAMVAARGSDTSSAQLAAALKDCISVMDRELNGLAVIQPELRQARAALAAAGVA